MKIKCTSIDKEWDQNWELLELGKEYNAYKVVISGWSTDVYLKEFEGETFNSSCFDDHFQDELNKAIEFFNTSEDYCEYYGIFIRDYY